MMILGCGIGALLAILATSVSIIGFSASCGAPAYRVFATKDESEDRFGQAVIDQCVQQSWVRLIAGGVVGGGVGLAGLVMVCVPTRRRQWSHQPGPQRGWQPPYYPPPYGPSG